MQSAISNYHSYISKENMAEDLENENPCHFDIQKTPCDVFQIQDV